MPAPATGATPTSRGHLNPGAPGVTLERFAVAPELAELVRHVWVARWDLPPGEISRQRVLTYPAFNVALAPFGASIHGPDPKLHVRELSGRSWTVGLLLRPAAGPLLSPVTPALLLGDWKPLTHAPLEEASAAMASEDPSASLGTIVLDWLGQVATRVDERGRLVNTVCRLAEEDGAILRVEELADRANVSRRSLERLTMEYIGVTPKWLIECRRLQAAATTLHAQPSTDLTELALSLHYVDYAHFSRRYKEVLGETPDQTRVLTKRLPARKPP